MELQSTGEEVFGKGKWRVTTLYCGENYNGKDKVTPGFDAQLAYWIPYLAFLLQDGNTNVLIDTGINERFLIDGKAWGGAPANAGEKDLVESLAKAGLKPDDIDIVLLTHLHNDHAGNCHLFPKAKMVAQKDEWDNLLNPVFAELVRRDYDFEIIPFLKSNRNFIKVDGDMQFLEGIQLIKTPGHTRGSMSIIVNTVNGLRIFVGDLFHLRCMAFPYLEEIMDSRGAIHKITPAPANWPTIPSSLIYNYYDYYASADKVKSFIPELDPKYLVCGHESSHMFTGV